MSDEKLQRITLRSIYDTVLEQFHLEKGIGYTIKQLVIRPQVAIHEYFYEDRKRMIRPSRFLLLTVAIATFLSYQFFPLGEQMAAELQKDPSYQDIPEVYRPAVNFITTLINKYFNLVFMSSLPFVTIGTYWLFPMKGYNFAEHLTLNIFGFCIQTIVFIFTIPFLTTLEAVAYLQAILVICYTLFFYKKVFEVSWIESIWRTTLVWLISQIGVSILLALTVAYLTLSN